MTLPKGYSPSTSANTSGGGNAGSSGSGSSGSGSSGVSRAEIERMIGRRVENMKGIILLGLVLCWVGTGWRNLCGCYHLSMGLSITKRYICSFRINRH